MARHYIKSTDLNRFTTPTIWVTIHEHLIRGDEVVITHYRRPVALITAYTEPEEQQ